MTGKFKNRRQKHEYFFPDGVQEKTQMSDSLLVATLLCISGGFQDTYTYNCREGVFANAQTGNMALLGQNLAMGNWAITFRYLVPVLAFAAGIYFSQKIRLRYKAQQIIHWRQIVVLLEIIVLFLAGWLPQEWNLLANIMVSFVCAMQVQSFRKVMGNAYATTMCIGNLRIATELLCNYRTTGEKEVLKTSLLYFSLIAVFIGGAAAGGVVTLHLQEKAIWICCPVLLLAFVIMFIKDRKFLFYKNISKKRL